MDYKKATKFGSPNFGYRIWFCTRLVMGCISRLGNRLYTALHILIKVLSMSYSTGLAAPGYIEHWLSMHLSCGSTPARPQLSTSCLYTFRPRLPRPSLIAIDGNRKVWDGFDTRTWPAVHGHTISDLSRQHRRTDCTFLFHRRSLEAYCWSFSLAISPSWLNKTCVKAFSGSASILKLSYIASYHA